jgi:hypothetical protein
VGSIPASRTKNESPQLEKVAGFSIVSSFSP